MALILGLPIMTRISRDNYRDEHYDNIMWNYQRMSGTFRSSSGCTRSEIRDNSSGGGFGGDF
jgi:uncharacterized membrane protein